MGRYGCGMSFLRADITALPLRAGSIDCVIEKSMMDTFLCADGTKAHKLIGDMLIQVVRVLRPGGTFASVNMQQATTLLEHVQETIAKEALSIDILGVHAVFTSKLPSHVQARGITEATLLTFRRR